jgi:5-methylcytosine-specific restriction enzyme subunit McrC
MGATITLFEHGCTSGFDWKDRDLVVLQRLNRRAGVEMLRPEVKDGKQELRAAQHVGVFRLGNRTVQVLPKIHQSGETADAGQRAREATRNLLHMLQIADEVPFREHGLASLLRRDMDWFEILTHIFATHLREEWQRGASRGYLEIEDDLPTLKGKWRIAEQIRHPGRDHLLAVAYDEFTADIPLNRVFRFVVERLGFCTRNGENRQILGELRQWLDEVTLLPSLSVNAATPALLNRLNRRLEPLLNLARLFLDGGAMQMVADNLTSFAFVIDMNRVFEAFVVNMVRKYRHQILPPDLPGHSQVFHRSGCKIRPVFQGIHHFR